MITCANCGSSYGGWKNFGFLELSDIVTIGADSHHFTVQKDNLLSFQRNYVEIGKDLLHGQYHSVKCISCAEVVGKKLFSCIVFDKEKLLYDSIQVKTSDTWVSKSRESPFDKLKVFELKDFKDAESITQQHLEPYVARRPSQRAESLLDRTSMNKKDHCQTKSTLLKGKNHYQKSTAFPQKCGFLKKNDINFAKPDRPKVGDSVNDMIQFLRSKKNVWDAGQIIYEFSSPNESNWKAITLRGITNDDSGKILHEIFSLLSLQEVRDGPNASVLYTPLSELTGLVGIMNYLRIGALREESVKQAMSLGRGGVQWLVIMDAALCAIQTVRYVLEKFVCVRSNAFMSSIIESFSRLIDTLVGDKFTETDTLDSWAPLLSAEDKCKSVGEAKNLALIMDGMKRMQKAADQARIQKSDAKNAEEKKREVKVASNRHRRGVSFLDDPARDNDYLKMNVTPTPDDLLCPPPELLPENHVEEELSTKSGQFDISQLSIAPKLPYRSNDHYLNTHFLLGFEDSVAQLRRGLQAFRDILAKDSGSTAIVPPTPPTPEKLKKACSSFCRSRDSGAYIYGDVSIDTVDCLRDGIGYVVSFSMYESRKVDWASSSRFMNGSLLCLSKDGTFNAKSIVVATVMRGVQAPKGSTKGWTPTITICIAEESMARFDPNSAYTMIESMVYFDAYRPVLEAQQSFGKNGDLPFADILLGKSKKVNSPAYLIEKAEMQLGTQGKGKGKIFLNFHSAAISPPVEKKGWDFSSVFPSMGKDYRWNPVSGDQFPCLPNEPPLDVSQREAIKQALSNELCIIQGPPGTGKTFVGVLISKILIRNQPLRRRGPVMFICQTNHALDQMLEHIYKFDRNIIRIGGRSESPIMQSLSLANIRKSRLIQIHRGDTRDAYAMKNRSSCAIRSALAQCKVLRSGGAGDAPFSNCVLARLYHMLCEIDPDAASEVEGVVKRSSLIAQKAAWDSCRNAADDLKVNNAWQDKTNGFAEWQSKTTLWQISMMATYTPNNHAPDVAVHIVDEWKKAKPLKKQRIHDVDAEGFTKIQRKTKELKRSGSDDDDEEDEEEDEEDEEEEEEMYSEWNPDALRERASRYTEEHDFFEYRALESNEEIVKRLVKRPIEFYPTTKLRERLAVRNLHDLPTVDRKKLIKSWGELLQQDAQVDLYTHMKDYKRAADQITEHDAVVDTAHLKSASAIGMTTSGAAKYSRILRELHVEVIVVEEAAAVLESSIIAALTSSTKHLVLIGDHVQLRPKVNEYNIATVYGLEISLFERLIRMGCPYVRLTTQRRMHPDVCELITPSIYKTLTNDPSVSLYPTVTGIAHRVVFITHEIPEDGQTLSGNARILSPLAAAGEQDKSKTNSHEAKYLVALLQHLLMQGYKSTQIVVLSMYLGQLMLMKRLAKDADISSPHVLTMTDQRMGDVRMSTTDNYQGEESDIVLLSLTRSNSDRKIGFVKETNRICVALSRARHGMYVTGNMSMIEEACPLWKTVCDVARSRGTLLDYLPLQCKKHVDFTVEARAPSDFSQCPNGGCRLQCNTQLDCGHICQMLCHPIPHSDINCIQECLKPRPPGCTHKCSKGCWEDCGPCPVKTKKLRTQCGHTMTVQCHIDADSVNCSEPCGYSMICGHSCREKCLSTGHDSLRHKCTIPCNRTPLCGHRCPKKCFEQCGQCLTPVVRSLRCGHLMKTECHVDTHTLVCILECGKDLPCGHKCAQPCGHADKCGTSCKEEVKKTVLKCRHTPCHTITVRCDKNIDEELCKQPCTSKLQCGHKCLGTCNDCQSVLSGGSGNGSGSGSPMVHKACSEPCRKALSCNHKCNGRHQCGDNSRCPPCLEPCAVKCIHRECELNCGVPCIPCEEQCSYSCPHMYCSMICCEPHYCILIGGAENTDMAAGEGLDSVCNERCRSNLKCGHRCQGFCGETCPSVCISCEPYQKLAVNDRLIALGCGHVFEDQFLHAKIMSEESGSQLKVPSCPTCQKTISGTHRYSSLVRKRLKSLEPEALRRFEEHLCREFEADDSPADPKIKELTAMLTSHSSLAQTLYLLLGKLYFQSDLILRSELFLNKALNAPTPWVRTEALTCLGYLKVCDGIPDDQFTTCVETSTERVLESALFYFTQIKGSTSEETVSREIFGRTTPCIAATVAKINEELLKLRFNKQAIAQAAEAARRQHNTRPSTRSSTAPPVERVTLLFPVPAAPSPLLVAVPASGGSSLHSAAAAGNIVKVKSLIEKGSDVMKKDDLGNTALLCAVENRHFTVAAYLAELSPWHAVNKAGRTFLKAVDVVNCHGSDNTDAKKAIQILAFKALTDKDADPSHYWAASKHYDNVACSALDELMDMIGLTSVKKQALERFNAISTDMARPVKSRVVPKQAMNFMFLGNPGTGKTTVARIFAKMLGELNIRKGDFEETSGQRLLDGGTADFNMLLKKVTPGVLFIDEVYQLEPNGTGGAGKAITNSLMEVTENDRDKLSVIVAGYRNDVIEKWATSNPGILSRFPYEIVFEDFCEKDLRTIFINLVNGANWRIENYLLKGENGGHDTVVDVALIAAKRLSRSAGRVGFANARSVRVMFESMQLAASKRQKQEMRGAVVGWVPPIEHSTTVTLIDLIGHPTDLSTSPLVKELMDMTGLEDVKKSVRALMEIKVTNYESELRGEEVLDVSLHRMFLGNPGTGKTTLAGLYGRILVSLGCLTNGEVIVVGASKLMGEHVGSTAKTVNNLMDSVKGKVLVIDEAYVLGTKNSLYGKEALDTLVERVQGAPGEDFAVILCGYEDEMKTMMRDCNPGLKRRFKSDDAFMFADYSDEDLAIIMVKRAQIQKVYVTAELAESCVKNVLAKQKAKQHFGNVGAVNNLLDSAKEKMMQRENKHKKNGLFVLLEEDFFTLQGPDVTRDIFSGLMNADNIKKHINDLIQDVNILKKKNRDPKKLLSNYSFEGAPGTGKSTVARAFGTVFHSLGLLSSADVVECKAMELIGEYVGHSGARMRAKMDEARGGVLFIDEAYGLHPDKNKFAKDVLEQLLANLTDSKYEGKMIVIIAGYTKDIKDLLRSNPGMTSRFKKKLVFNDWTPSNCLDLLLEHCARVEDGAELPEELHQLILHNFEQLIERSGWGNARDVNTVYDDMRAERERRLDNEGVDSGPYIESDMKIFTRMIAEREEKDILLLDRNAAPDEALYANDAVQSYERRSVRNMPKQVEIKMEAILAEEGPAEKTVQEALSALTLIDPNDLWSSLDEALTEMGYDIYSTAIILSKGKLPEELVALVAKKVASTADRVRPMLEAQCPSLLLPVLALIEKIKKELEIQRKAQDDMAKADEAERERLRIIEKLRQKEAVLERVQMIGKCCMGYEWIKIQDGYQCAGGSHFVSDAQVNLV